MKKLLVIGIAIIFIGIIAVGVMVYIQPKTKSLGVVTYGYQNWPGVLPYLVAYEKGYFKEQGLDINLVKEESYVNEIDNLLSGKLDFVGDIALIDVVQKVSSGNDLKVVLATDYSNGADGIVVKKEIQSIRGLKGKKIAVEKGTLGEYLLFDALRKNNLALTDVQEINLTAQESAQAFIDGKVDAAVTYEPDYSKAVRDGNGQRLYSSADSPGLIIDVLAMRAEFIANNEDKVKAIISAYLKASDYIISNPAEAYNIGAKYFNITPEEFKDQVSGIKMMGRNENRDSFVYKTSIDSLHGAIILASDFLFYNKITSKEVDSTDVVRPEYLRALIK